MDIHTQLMTNFSEEFIRERRQSWATVRYGTESPSVVIIRRLAAGVRRCAAAIESWANGSTEARQNFRQPNVPAR